MNQFDTTDHDKTVRKLQRVGKFLFPCMFEALCHKSIFTAKVS